ncbi:MAG: hypothetical protein SFX73_14985 [Kofleriaceae bacterium]|nr:hypothetical protein [Kofleriaceae bacterium]
MTELSVLRVLLLASMALGPFATHRHFFAKRSRRWAAAHVGALVCAAVGLLAPAPILCVAWLVFCAASFALFLRARGASLRSPRVLAACVPFLFSNVAAVWLVGGANDLQLLGYGAHFSYYAALHGNVLGWIMIGTLAVLADRDSPRRGVYLATVFACLVSFLLIAFGIDRLRVLKPVGVIGLTLALPVGQLAFLRDVWTRDRPAFVLGCISLAGLAVTMVLAWRNELALPVPFVAGIRGIVSVHGALNALVVAPCFLLAVALAGRGPAAAPAHVYGRPTGS